MRQNVCFKFKHRILSTYWFIQFQSQEMCSTFRVETEIMCDVVPKGMQLLQNL